MFIKFMILKEIMTTKVPDCNCSKDCSESQFVRLARSFFRFLWPFCLAVMKAVSPVAGFLLLISRPLSSNSTHFSSRFLKQKVMSPFTSGDKDSANWFMCKLFNCLLIHVLLPKALWCGGLWTPVFKQPWRSTSTSYLKSVTSITYMGILLLWALFVASEAPTTSKQPQIPT